MKGHGKDMKEVLYDEHKFRNTYQTKSLGLYSVSRPEQTRPDGWRGRVDLGDMGCLTKDRRDEKKYEDL